MKSLIAASALAFAGFAFASATGEDLNSEQAMSYCKDAAERLQILAEDRESYMAECLSDYAKSPPGDIGVDPEPASSGY